MEGRERALASGLAARLDAGMRAQLERRAAELAAGAERVGWKIGLNDPAARRQTGLDGPLVGTLVGTRVIPAGGVCPLRPGARSHVEAELAIRVGRDVEAGESPERARGAIAALAPAIEVVDYSLPADGLEGVLAHSLFHQAVRFGNEVVGLFAPPAPRWPRVLLNGRAARTPEPTLVPRDLGALVALVADTLDRYGETLRRGDRILSGSFTRPLRVEPADAVTLKFGPLGRVDVGFG